MTTVAPAIANASVRVNYDATVLRPLGDPAKDVFKASSTIPVKISVADCDGSHPSDLEVRVRVVKTSGTPPPQEINEPVSSSDAARTGFMCFADGHYVYNLSGKALPDPSATYRVEMTCHGQVVTASFGVKRWSLGELGRSRLPDHGHLDLTRVFELVLDLTGDLV